jgi:adenine-specific DNA methylase
MSETTTFIEVQFPVSKLSKESYKERKAGDSQTLNSLGKWHGRKPLVLVRALILGLLIPATDDPKKDRDIFLKLMTMDDEGMWRRCKGLSAREAANYLTPPERDEVLTENARGQIAWCRELREEKRKRYAKRAFLRMGYDDRLKLCLRPEEIDGPDAAAWGDINAHLMTSASSLVELVRELGERRFGHVPRVGDAFAGGGSIPFEAARLGCDAFANDLNPTAALQNYGALNLVGGSPETMEKVKAAQHDVYEAVRQQVAEWVIERNEFGWEADVFLYCAEVSDPITGWHVPMLPTFVVDPGERVILRMEPNHVSHTISLVVKVAESDDELQMARQEKTVDNGVRSPYDRQGNYIPPEMRQTVSSRSLRGREGLRRWEKSDWKPRPDDVYQERLFCIRWILPDFERLIAIEQVLCAGIVAEYDGWNRAAISPAVNAQMTLLPQEDAAVIASVRNLDWAVKAIEFLHAQDAYAAVLPGAEWGEADVKSAAGAVNKARRSFPSEVQSALEVAHTIPRRQYAAPTALDIERERKVEALLGERFDVWQAEGYIPSLPIIPGTDINRPTIARGWTWWHHLYNPRQLLINGLFSFISASFTSDRDLDIQAGFMLAQMKLADWCSRICRWDTSGAKCQQLFYAPGIPTPFVNYACRASRQYENLYNIDIQSQSVLGKSTISLGDAAIINRDCDLWITDPGYGDMAVYAEYSELFLSWIYKRFHDIFPDWYSDSKRALAVELAGDNFAKAVYRCYLNLANHTQDGGYQIVMFIQQDVQVWADLCLLLWAAGLQVANAWTIGTETVGDMRQGSFIQGTACLVLKKRTGGNRGDLSEIRPEVQIEVRNQLKNMLDLDDRESPNFTDADYTQAAYAAALRVITSYDSIREIDVKREIERGGRPDPSGIVRGVIEHALREATDFLVPDGLERSVWKGCSPEERLYLKGVEVEAHGEHRNGVYQEFARGFGVREYRDLLQSDIANETRLRTPSELKGRNLDSGPLGGTILRGVLYAIYQTADEGMDPAPAIGWLRGKYPGMSFFDARQSMFRMLRYLATKPSGERMPHWKKDAEAAYLLAARLENES